MVALIEKAFAKMCLGTQQIMHGFQCWDIGSTVSLSWFCVPWKSKNIYGRTMFGSNEIKNGSHKTYSKTLLFSSSFHMSGAGPIRTWLPVMPWRPGHISLAVVTPWSFRQVSTIHWNGRLNWKRPGKLPNLPSRFKLPSECHAWPASHHFSMFCFSSSGCHRRGWHRRTWWTQTSESSDREVGERQGWTPWETCTSVRGIFALYVNLYLCKTEHCCVVLLVDAGTRFQEVERARHCIKFKKIEGDGPDEGFVWYYKGRDVGNLQFPPICSVSTVSKVSWGLVTALF